MDGIRRALIFVTVLPNVMDICYGYTHDDRDSFPLVTTRTGDIRGQQTNIEGNDVSVFLGVPYAEPPVGNRRFKKPVPKRRWSGVYNASERPPPCMQNINEDVPWFSGTPSEDCLYLNVWAPGKLNSLKAESKRKPVLLWIHGGGFYSGYSALEVYDGAVLAAVEKSIVVSVNYRLGSFGYLTSGTDEAPGNVGMYDQVLAMKWVKNNIRSFNGDPEKITLFGESSGATCVGMHLISPLSRNLFKRAIMESGSPYHPTFSRNPSEMVNISNIFAAAVRCSNDTINIFTDPSTVLECLRQTDAEQLASVEGVMLQTSGYLFLPVYGDDYLPVDPITAMDKGDFKRTELLIGTNKDEGSMLLYFLLPSIFGTQSTPDLDKAQAETIIIDLFRNSTNPPPQAVADYYLQDISDTDSLALTKAVYDSYADNIISCPAVFFAETFSKRNEAYYYFFTERPDNSPWGEWMGVVHSEEIPFVFGVPVRNPSDYTAEEIIFSRTMMKRWVTFGKTGAPTVSKTERWPKFTKNRPRYLELNAERQRIGEGPHKKGCDFWRPYFVAGQQETNRK